MLRTISLALFLFAFWLLLSGHYTPWLIGSGAVVSVALALAGRRLGFSDEEGHPVDRLPAGLAYWSWLLTEIVKSSLQVARVVVDPKLPITPRLFEIKMDLRSAVGVATYANSITLTPGTVTVGVDREHDLLRVHALTAEGEAGLRAGEMEARVRRFEGET
ncbi:cation transporter [Kaistia algarum]|uniref:Na+/H+ antiporter subunit E n=1 Tax=Kaistia algarum TaxID=2083279 RepID=UPI000CE897EE|nr:Na+/H+ antiporter subunit E [Kaistia algarum]MCX5512178.1 Na+/H+ antiporter subunit E [Kaistia algarum]PPE80276.1 cation transporter [Kaistia algarum]